MPHFSNKSRFSVFVAILLLTFLSKNVLSNCTSQGTGDWTDAGSWTCDVVSTPGCCDTIFLRAGDDIEVNTTIDLTGCGPIHIEIFGTLRFKTGKKLMLPPGSTIDLKSGGEIIPGGGGGNSNYIEIGGNSVWTAAEGTTSGPLFYDGSGVLPIELVEFNAICSGEKVQINWITASETNNSHFEIQRSSDGLNFETIIRCQGAGNSSMYISYLEIDNNPLEGISYYRLKQVDYDGAAEVFSMVPVKCLAEKEPAISLFPNPVSKDAKQVNLLLEGFEGEEVLVILRDITGKEIASKVRIVKSGYEIHAYPLDVEINAGNYIVTASSNNSIYSKVLIID